MKRAYVMWEGRCFEFTAVTFREARSNALAWLARQQGYWREPDGWGPPEWREWTA